MNTMPSSRPYTERNRKTGAFRRVAYVGSLVGLFGIAACTTTATLGQGTGACGLDTSLTCEPGTEGYSCTGVAEPQDSNSSLLCNTDGAGDYCCVTTECSTSDTVPCAAGDTGYSCSIGATSPASAVLTCTMTTANNLDLYCCTPATTAACITDATVSCQAGTGYTCSGTSQPEDVDPTVVCSADQESGQFCCVSGSSCAYDATLACETGAAGYTCSGTSTPNSVDSSLVCSEPNSANAYCCFTTNEATASTCTQDQTVTGCQANAQGEQSYGFSCTGADTPDQDYSGITCSTPTAGTGNTLYCCVYRN
jgi:hypothetical protein